MRYHASSAQALPGVDTEQSPQLTNEEIDKTKVLFGMDLGGDKEAAAGKTSSNFDPSVMRLVKAGERVSTFCAHRHRYT